MHRKGQSAMEYALIFSVVVAAFIAMQIYLKRAVSANLNNLQAQVNEQPE